MSPLNIEFPMGSSHELERFAEINARLPRMFRAVVNDPRQTHTAIIVPSLSLPQGELAKIAGAGFYEERLLCLLMLLRQPRMHIILVTSQPIHPTIIDYYLHLLAGIPGTHARKRLTLLSTSDGAPRALTEKILERPSLMAQINNKIKSKDHAHMVCFNSTPLERTLAVRLGVPLYACDPALLDLGTKSGSRKVFREAGVPMPAGFEDLQNSQDVANALVALWEENPSLSKAVVKLNEGFSGEGNAIFRYDWVRDTLEAAESHGTRVELVHAVLPKLEFEAVTETWERFDRTMNQMGGVVEVFIDGNDKFSPSVQCRVTPVGEAQAISTHDQILGGPSGQVFLGCEFPCRDDYRLLIQNYGRDVASRLAAQGVIGRFGVDFIVTRGPDGKFQAHGIEINLRKGGTTHPFLMLKFLTDGRYYPSNGQFISPTGLEKYYIASDNLMSEAYRGLRPDDLVDIAVYHSIHFSAVAECGVVFHLIGALSQYGKTGVTCIGNTLEEARSFYNRTLEILNRETSLVNNPRLISLP
ncbi:MAG: carboxylate-amine ligase [Deltaproteobacteria bacterium CG17_big_fil_post_rev_8_21_14_2_50_63_7]|nr:MAG: carboxylate-amine ligase [Deltaproteobacteria bacterium CG17_big_fil_post_rev_8_21_14_2_50_63_7]